MKRKSLLFILILSTLSSFAQTGVIGFYYKLSEDKQYLRITDVDLGWPADMANLKAGDRILAIDGVAVSDIGSDFSKRLNGEPGTFVKLSVEKFSRRDTTIVQVGRITRNSGISEKYLHGRIFTQDWSNKDRFESFNLNVISDDSRNMFKYKTYDFEYTSVDYPIVEKTLYKELEKELRNLGLHKSDTNPDIIINMSFYSGQNEKYIPPQQIVSTRINKVYTVQWGYVPIAVTTSHTVGGTTEVTYLSTITLKFLDAKEMSTSPVPPEIWSGTVSETSNTKKLIQDECDHYFFHLLQQFPTVYKPYADAYFLRLYAYTGIIYNVTDLQTIGDVIPGSPAHKAGLQAGDIIKSINKYRMPASIENVSQKNSNEMSDTDKIIYYGNFWSINKVTALRYLFMFSGLKFQAYEKGVNTLHFVVLRNGKKMEFEVKPEEDASYILINRK